MLAPGGRHRRASGRANVPPPAEFSDEGDEERLANTRSADPRARLPRLGCGIARELDVFWGVSVSNGHDNLPDMAPPTRASAASRVRL